MENTLKIYKFKNTNTNEYSIVYYTTNTTTLVPSMEVMFTEDVSLWYCKKKYIYGLVKYRG